MSTLLLKKLFEVHKEGLALKPDDRTAWHKERMNAAGQTPENDSSAPNLVPAVHQKFSELFP